MGKTGRRLMFVVFAMTVLPDSYGVAPGAAQAQEAAAPQYTELPIDPALQDRRKVNEQRTVKNQILLQGFSGAERDQFERWYTQYQFRLMTQPERFGEISDIRLDVIGDMQKARSDEARRIVRDLTFTAMKVLIGKEYHPVTRYNAMLLIATLNLREADTLSVVRTPPEPLPEALDVMITELKNPDQHDAVKLAALLGILRHVALDRQLPEDNPIPPAKKDEITQLMLAIVTAKDPPPGRSATGHVWLQRRAIELLSVLGSPGSDAAICKELEAIVGDDQAPLSLRCTAAQAFDAFNYDGVTTLDPVAVAQKLGALAAIACRLENDRVRALSANPAAATSGPQPGGSPFGGPGYPGGSFPGGSGSPSGGSPRGSGSPSGSGFPGGGYPGGGYPGAGYPGAGGAAAKKNDDAGDTSLLTQTRRRLKTQLYATLLGLRGQEQRAGSRPDPNARPTTGGIARLAAGNDQQKQEVQKIIDAVQEIYKATDGDKLELDAMMTAVREKVRALEGLLPKPKAEEEPVADQPGADVPGAETPGAPAGDNPPPGGKADGGNPPPGGAPGGNKNG